MTFIELLDKYGIEGGEEGSKHCHAGWYQFDCPMCSPGTGYWRMGYHMSRHYTVCWVCGYHWIGKVVQEITGLSAKAAAQLLDDVDIPLRDDGTKPKGKLILPKHLVSLSPAHRYYLQSRHLSPDKIVKLWDIKGIGLSTEAGMSYRIFIPAKYNSETVSWTTRSISDEDPNRRYRMASQEQEALSLKSLLYGEDFAGSTIIVVEGPLDAWRIGPGSVATLGVGYTRQQLLRISKYTRRYICFDNEPKAQEVALDLVDNLKVLSGETWNVVTDSKDAGSASHKEIRSLRRLLQ